MADAGIKKLVLSQRFPCNRGVHMAELSSLYT